MKISVVVPVHNEADNIGKLIDEIVTTMSTYCHGRDIDQYEMIVVDDGSDDTTWNVLLNASDGQLPLRIVRHNSCCGQSTALRSGVSFATGDVVVTLDGDGQNDPADIPHLLSLLVGASNESQPDLVVGDRSRSRRDTWWRRFSSRVANAVRSRVLRDDTPDTGCGLKVIRRKLYLELPYFDHMHRFLPALVRRQGGRIVSTPVNHRPRERGRSHYGTWDRLTAGIVDMIGVMWLLRRVKLPIAEEWQTNELRNDLGLGRNHGPTSLHRTVRRAVA